ncbi:MAG: hypothetical protein GWN53_17190 [Gammaproteobacteria bacterium]|uniref:Sulfotransferase n=1 Tax=Candidatus Kutchimonas denitrificans TaxID=3056748 RepID=A0AAE4ZDN9_9BACT|nr:sulfotransferase [Candidatus Kutchimonas denitrificans]NIV53577.1 hypothetical protein [Gammaproteobacteria bacterium]
MTGPLVVTGTGGSGTRVFARIAMHAGWHLGTRLNESEDNMRIADLENDPVGTRFLANGGPTEHQLAHYMSVVESERWPHERWGWKHPQSMYFMRWLHAEFPHTIRVLHVVRDGRDMAYARNVFEHWFGPLLLTDEERNAPLYVRKARLWQASNLRLTELCEERFPDRYLRVRLEDLCKCPECEVRKVFRFLGAKHGKAGAVAEVEQPDTLGRWQNAPEPEQRAVEAACRNGLEAYGYV